ncbi:MAG: NUDIX hydrolase [Hyphomicrobiaceae bacterium]
MSEINTGGVDEPPKQQPVRPRDSSTLIIVDTASGEPRVLMGKRRMDQIFMPGKYVFPGGRVDTADRTVESADELPPSCAAKLLVEMRDTPSPSRARAIALAAIRETYEEAGILIGAPGKPTRTSESEAWQSFFTQGYVPSLSRLRFFARAITPPGRPRRYDSRFFYVDAAAIALRADALDEELSSLDWFTFEEMRALDLPAITRVVLEDLIDRLALDKSGAEASDSAAVPFYSHRNGTSRRRLITA